MSRASLAPSSAAVICINQSTITRNSQFSSGRSLKSFEYMRVRLVPVTALLLALEWCIKRKQERPVPTLPKATLLLLRFWMEYCYCCCCIILPRDPAIERCCCSLFFFLFYSLTIRTKRALLLRGPTRILCGVFGLLLVATASSSVPLTAALSSPRLRLRTR